MPKIGSLRTPAFVTGSYAYGKPVNGKSDIDLVVLISQEDLDKLARMKPEEDDEKPPSETIGRSAASLRFGDVNLILCVEKEQYDYWRDGTAELKKLAPVTRDEAVEFLNNLWQKEYVDD